jgi:cellulose synthase/poly-beta-1,6-N-acetylglucosamine synthase-like glycosyltransferase
LTVSHRLIEVAGTLLILITIPGTVELALLTFAALLPTAKWDWAEYQDGRIKRLAVVIPAHNEAATVTRAVRSLAQCELPPALATMSIIVVADNSNDATAELASTAGARVIVRLDHEHRGKGFALEFAFAKLLGEGFDAVLVIDADSVVDANLPVEVVRLLNLGADGVQVSYLGLNADASASARLRNLALMAFNVLRPLGRDRLGLSSGITGSGFALSRQTLEAVPYDVHSIVEDLDYHLRLVRAGRKIAFASRTTVRGEMPVGGRAARTQRARWEGGRLRMIAQNVPALARAAARGNLRSLEPLLDLLLLPLAIHVLLLGGTAAFPFAPAQIYAAFALTLVAFHVGVAITVAGGKLADFAGLLAAPGYLAWKLALLPAILRSARSNAEWTRTER